jgi:homoserine kinase
VTFVVTAPATSANLGPGFDCLGLALSLRNRVEVSPAARWQITVEGEGAGLLPEDETNLVVQAMHHLAGAVRKPLPSVRLMQHNEIPVGSGLGSSAAAAIAGLLAADALLETHLPRPAILALAAELEGHADNVAAALYGGLVLVAGEDVAPLPFVPLNAVVVLPAVSLSTRAARAVLPQTVPLADAVFNLGRLGLLLHAFAQGDQTTLARGMADRLHQPYRAPLLPGLDGALAAAQSAGAAACLSGAGPALIAFPPPDQDRDGLARMIIAAFGEAGLASRSWQLSSESDGATLSSA